MSTLRFTGLSSGIDTESVVKALMTTYQSKIDKQKANKTKSEWTQDIYKDLNTKLKKFNSSLKSLKTASNLYSSKTTVSQSGVINVKSAKYNGDENHSILVKQVAEKANVNTSVVNSYTDADGKQQKVVSSTSLDDVLGHDTDARKAVITIGDAVVDLNECSTIQDIVNTVNEKDSSIKMNYSDAIGAFTISSKETGKQQQITLGSATKSVDSDGKATYTKNTSPVANDTTVYSTFQRLGIGFSSSGFTDTYQGQNALIEYNNSLSFESESNDIEINGLTFTAQAASNSPVVVSVNQDTEQMYGKIKDFINSYNELLDEITTKYYADSASGYDVLTDDEKESMKDKEVEAWEDKIKGSLLRRDSTLYNIYNAFRESMTADYSEKNGGTLDEQYSLMSQIGIASSDWTAQGKLTINEDTLKQAIATNGDKVADLIASVSSNLESKLNAIANTTSDYKSYGSFFNDKLIKQKISDYDTAISKAQDRYDTMEEYYYNKFTAMEKAFNNANSTSSLFSNL